MTLPNAPSYVVATCLFLMGLLLSLVLTPPATKLGKRMGMVDKPNERKIHQIPTPRAGGISMFVGFIVTVFIGNCLTIELSSFMLRSQTIAFAVGAVVVFAIGVLDDAHNLNARTKFIVQTIAATIAFVGGVRIDGGSIVSPSIHSAVLDYCLTVFWFVLFINAINLIDGLDGLAGGIAFFVCAMLTPLLLFQDCLVPALLFAALSGNILGFLRYNFYRATVFMGDSGSYFLGYTIAGLSIIASAKVQTSALILLPVLAMGVPIFDTILSPVRRFIIGKRLFQPDKSHIHHKLLEIGLSTKNVVLLIYAISAALSIVSLILVNMQDRAIGILLIAVAIVGLMLARRLGYFGRMPPQGMVGWFRDIVDVVGLSHSRRSFLGMQMEIDQSRTVKEMWENVCRALETMDFDAAYFRIGTSGRSSAEALFETGNEPVEQSYCWARDYNREPGNLADNHALKVNLPLLNGSPNNTNLLLLYKDLTKGQLDRFTLKRIEQLRESMTNTLDLIQKSNSRVAEERTGQFLQALHLKE